MSLSHFMIAVAVMAIWGFNFVMIRVALHDVPPLFLCALRFFFTAIPALFFIKRPEVSLTRLTSYSIIMFVIQFGLLFWGMHAGVSPGLASILCQLQGFFTILLAVLFLGDRIHLLQVVGALAAFSGIAIVGIHMHGNMTVEGFSLIIASTICWAIGNLFLKKMGQISMISLIVWASMIAWPLLLVATYIIDGKETLLVAFERMSIQSILAIAYITYASTVFGYSVWNWLLMTYPLPSVAPFTLLVPIFGIFSSVIVLDESLDSWKIDGALLVLAGLLFNTMGTKVLAKRSASGGGAPKTVSTDDNIINRSKIA